MILIKNLVSYFKKEIKKHLFDYLILLTGGVFLIIALNFFRGERLIEFILLLLFTSLYIVWGIYHHVINNTMHLKIVLEYVLIGFICLFLLKILIYP